MKAAWNEYWDEVYKPGMRWLSKHWKGYMIFAVVVYVVTLCGAMAYIYRHEIADKVKSLVKKKDNEED